MLRDGDLLVLLALAESSHALFIRVVHHLSEVIGLQARKNVEEVLARWAFPLGVLIGKIRLENGVLPEHGVNPAN